jgi:hypothetical protein
MRFGSMHFALLAMAILAPREAAMDVIIVQPQAPAVPDIEVFKTETQRLIGAHRANASPAALSQYAAKQHRARQTKRGKRGRR